MKRGRLIPFLAGAMLGFFLFAAPAPAQTTDGAGSGGGGGRPPDPDPKARVACESRGQGVPRFCVATELEVESTGIDGAGGAVLAAAFGVPFAADPGQVQPGEAYVENGVFRYLDPERFQAIATRILPLPMPIPGDDDGEEITHVQILDVPALAKRLRAGSNVLDDDEARNVASGLLGPELLPADATATVSNSSMQMLWNSDSLVPPNPDIGETAELLLDTQVSYTTVLDGIPVVGPGAKINVALVPGEDPASDPIVVQAQYAARGLTDGGRVAIRDPELGPEICRAALDFGPDDGVSARLVYYAPPLRDGANPGALVPHFECGPPEDGTAEVLPLVQYVPAVVDAPKASITSIETDGAVVTATGAVTGGTAPYIFSWSSGSTTGEPPLPGNPTTYTLVPEEPGEVNETLVFTVTDANGLAGVDIETFVVDARSSANGAETALLTSVDDPFAPRTASHGRATVTDVGGVGACYTPNSMVVVDRWRDHTAAGGIPSQFTLYPGVAKKSHFLSDTFEGGDDHNYADDVDMLFYIGHGTAPPGFTFLNTSGSGPTYIGIKPTEMRLGDRDLEWLIVYACQALKEDWTSRSQPSVWGPTFNGLHAIYGFHTDAVANSYLAAYLADYMLGVSIPAKRIHEAYVQAAVDTQPSNFVWAALYPVSYDYEWNRYDSFWTVRPGPGPDVPASRIYYWARFTGPT